MRINQYIARRSGYSRRKADRLIEEGQVFVNGKKLQEKGYQVKQTDRVTVAGDLLTTFEPVYYLFHKPSGVLSSHSDPHGGPYIYDFLPDIPALTSAGRLDRSSEGLLVVTNDGDLVWHLTHPSNEVEKIYEVKTDQKLTEAERILLCSGITTQYDTYRVLRIDQMQRDGFWYRIVLMEGKKREIRRMMAHMGKAVLRLIRIQMGSLSLGDLPQGQYRELTEKEVEALWQKDALQ